MTGAVTAEDNFLTEVYGSKTIIHDIFRRAQDKDYAAMLLLTDDLVTSGKYWQVLI